MKNRLSDHLNTHLAQIKEYYQNCEGLTKQAVSYRDILARYYNLLIPASASVLEVGCGARDLLSRLRAAKRSGVDLSPKQIVLAKEKIPNGKFYVQAGEDLVLPTETFDYIILSETVNQAGDVQRIFESLRLVSHENTRLIVNIYSSLWRPIVWLATALGLRNRQPESNWLSKEDVKGLMHITGWELIRHEPRTLCPVKLFGIEQLLNRFAAPLLAPLCFSSFLVGRLPANRREKTVSVVIPARNESADIEAAVKRTPEMGIWTELIFAEGNSKDNTWDEIRRVKEAHPHKRIRMLQQTGKGKGNAVREAFDIAS